MRKLTTRLLCLMCIASAMGASGLQAQATHRERPLGATAKIESITEDLPCSGSVLFQEDFESGIPVGWTVIDADDKTPRPELQLQKGWQGRTDYDDTTNHLAVSPSWYVDTAASNDWLITPLLTVGNNSCLSWKAFSLDQYYLEQYDVRVATTLDTNAFLANPALLTISAESGTSHYNSVSMAAYAGQSVYIAFRQTSYDKFVLCLDDVRLANVNAIDIGVYELTYGTPEPGDTIWPKFKVANYGSDTIRSFDVYFSVDGGAPERKSVTAVSLPPNLTVTFTHDSLYISDSLDAFHSLCGWTTLPNGVADQDISNDSLCVTMAVGHPVGAADPNLSVASVQVYPNPFSDRVHLQFQGLKRPEAGLLRICDLQGRIVLSQSVKLAPSGEIALDLAQLPIGMYLATVELEAGHRLEVKLIKH